MVGDKPDSPSNPSMEVSSMDDDDGSSSIPCDDTPFVFTGEQGQRSVGAYPVALKDISVDGSFHEVTEDAETPTQRHVIARGVVRIISKRMRSRT